MRKITPQLARQRRAVALDVIEQLKAEKFQAQQKVYVQFADCSLDEATGNLQPLLNKAVTKSKPCTVCAMGGMLLSQIRLFNKIDAEKIIELNSVNTDRMRKKLSELFSNPELNLIEACFEQAPLYKGCRIELATEDETPKWFRTFYYEWEAASKFRDVLNWLDDNMRLILLMQSVASIAEERVTLTAMRRAVTLQLLYDPRFKELQKAFLI